MTVPGGEIPFCSILSQAADEPPTGSATQVSAWFLLEVDAAWGRKATDENELPPAVQAHLRAHLDAVPGARAQLIKQTPRPERRGIAFFVAVPDAQPPALYAFRLADYENLTALDLTTMVGGGAAFERYRSDERLLIVCTNGKRDACCAKFGLETYEALSRLGGELVWRTTHLGGHRFAPNVVCLPDGLMYGRVSADSAAPLLDACRAGRIDLGHFRGRSAYDEGAQVAEHLLRERTGLTALTRCGWFLKRHRASSSGR